MKIVTNDMITHLHGDLTHSGVTHNIITSLAAALQKLTAGSRKNIRIDCGRIHTADSSGLRLLYVWMQCARFRGVEPELINLSASLQQTMQRLGLGQCFTGSSLAGKRTLTY
jgi:anti-anti-sigma regulatory factor